MLSKAEINFLENPESFNEKYQKSLRCRLRRKSKLLKYELRLLERAGFIGVAKNSDEVAQNSCFGGSANRTPLQNPSDFVVRSPGFEPGSSAWEADVLAKLDYNRFDVRLRILAFVS